jgi:hypothetical protein
VCDVVGKLISFSSIFLCGNFADSFCCVLLQLANEFWSDAALRQKRPFNPQIVEDVYQKEMVGTE